MSPVFKLGGFGSSRATVRTETALNDQWVSLTMRLVEADNGRAYELKRSVGYQNVGGGRSGSSDDVGEILGVPPGRYTLAIDALSPAGAPVTQGKVQVYRSKVDWSNYWLFAGFLVLWPLGAWARARSFETERWSESDYAPGEDDDDETGTGGLLKQVLDVVDDD